MNRWGTRTLPDLRRALFPIAFLMLCFAVVLGAAAGGAREQQPFTIGTATKPSLGTYLTDSHGNTLYYSTNDLPGVSNCTGGCEAVWLPFAPSSIRVSRTLDAADFGYIVRDKGRRQVTYKGWPLYLYARDWAAHDTNGQGLYGSWYVVQPALFGPSGG